MAPHCGKGRRAWIAPGPGGGSLRRCPCCKRTVRLPTYATVKPTRDVTSRCTVRFHCCVYCSRRFTKADVIFGVSQEFSTIPNEQGWPGLGLGDAIGAPWKKFEKVRLGAAGGRSLNTCEFRTNGTVTTVLFTRFVSGNAKNKP